jgi:predicted nucleic acid-binding protein
MGLQGSTEAQTPVIVLVDTCVWSLALRRTRTDLNSREGKTVRELEDLILEGRARLLGVVRQELLSGIRHKPQFDRIAGALRSFENIGLDVEDYEEAASSDNRCRSAGMTGSTTDFLICAVAIRRGWAVFTTDQDFARFGKILPINLMGI